MFKINYQKVLVRALLIISAPVVALLLMVHILYLALKPSTKYESFENLCSYYKIK